VTCQPGFVPGLGSDGIVVGVHVQLYRLLTQPERVTEAAADRNGPFAAARDPVRRDIGRRADGPSPPPSPAKKARYPNSLTPRSLSYPSRNPSSRAGLGRMMADKRHARNPLASARACPPCYARTMASCPIKRARKASARNADGEVVAFPFLRRVAGADKPPGWNRWSPLREGRESPRHVSGGGAR
jgi:hypothetical protein